MQTLLFIVRFYLVFILGLLWSAGGLYEDAAQGPHLGALEPFLA
jgi:hypothetical protein